MERIKRFYHSDLLIAILIGSFITLIFIFTLLVSAGMVTR